MSSQLLIILLYSGSLLLVGLWVARKVSHVDDFLVAGRRFGPGLVFASFLAANIGAGSTVGAAGLAYSIGWSAWWWVGSAGLGSLVLANFVGPRIWGIARREGFRSLGDYLEWRYDRRFRLAIATVLWLGALGLLAAQLIALSLLLQVVAGVPPWTGAVVGGLLMTAYFTAGGLLSSAVVNVVQLIVLLCGFFLAVQFGLRGAGGWQAVTAAIAGAGSAHPAGYLHPLGIGLSGILHYFSFLAPSFIVSPGLIQKVYTARSTAAVRVGVSLNAVLLLAFAFVPPALGIMAAAAFPDLTDPQFALFRAITRLLPTWLGLLGLAAVFSAEVSTCDAVLSMLATGFAVDIYRGWMRPGAGGSELLRVSRLSAAAAGLLSVSVAILAPSIIDALRVFYSVVSVALFAPVVCGLYSDRPNARGAAWSLAVSLPLVFLLHLLPDAILPGLLDPVPVGIAVSFATLFAASRRPPGTAEPPGRPHPRS